MTMLTETARIIFKQALDDCNVEQAVARHVSAQDSTLHIGNETFDSTRVSRIRIVAVGKAANGMLRGLLQQFLHPHVCEITGVLIAPEPPEKLPNGFRFFAGGHPLPNQASFDGARAALNIVGNLDIVGNLSPALAQKRLAQKTLGVFLISGGASAMMELPLDPAISLADTVEFHRTLVASGAKITEMNCVRKHFSAVKGGRLAIAAGDAICRSLLISDVPPGHEDSLGSGPTLPDSSTVAECREILTRRALQPQFPAAVQRFFESDELHETPKSNELQEKARTLLSSGDLAHAAANSARELGFSPIVDNTSDDWEYRAAAKYLLDRLRDLRRQNSRICLISTGEVSVALPPQAANAARIGVGGRNQQFALFAATLLDRRKGPVAVLSAGSDGMDGSSTAAGAVVDENTLSDGSLKTTALEALETFNAFPWLHAMNATIVTGPSGNNLRDLRILLAGN